MSVIRMVLRLLGNVQTAHPAYLFFFSVASILLDFRTNLECQILICFVPRIPLVLKKKKSLPLPPSLAIGQCTFS